MAGTIYETHNGRKLVHMGRFSNTMGRRIADPVQQWLEFFFFCMTTLVELSFFIWIHVSIGGGWAARRALEGITFKGFLSFFVFCSISIPHWSRRIDYKRWKGCRSVPTKSFREAKCGRSWPKFQSLRTYFTKLDRIPVCLCRPVSKAPLVPPKAPGKTMPKLSTRTPLSQLLALSVITWLKSTRQKKSSTSCTASGPFQLPQQTRKQQQCSTHPRE